MNLTNTQQWGPPADLFFLTGRRQGGGASVPFRQFFENQRELETWLRLSLLEEHNEGWQYTIYGAYQLVCDASGQIDDVTRFCWKPLTLTAELAVRVGE